MDLIQYTKCPYKTREETGDEEGRGHVLAEAEADSMFLKSRETPRIAGSARSEEGGGTEQIPLKLSVGSASTSVWDFWPPELSENRVLWF